MITEIDSQHSPEGKLYNENAIYFATFFGGPLAAGYIIAENFKALNDKKKYKVTWIITIIISVLLFASLFLVVNFVNIPNYVIPAIYTAVAYGIIKHYQGKQIEEHISRGGKTYSRGRTFLVGLIAVAITLAVIIPTSWLLTSNEKAVTYYYPFNAVKNEIEYYPDRIDKSEVATLCRNLAAKNFFDSTFRTFCFVDKVNNTIEIHLPYITPVWKDSVQVNYHKAFQKEIQSCYKQNKIAIIICDTMYNEKLTIR